MNELLKQKKLPKISWT